MREVWKREEGGGEGRESAGERERTVVYDRNTFLLFQKKLKKQPISQSAANTIRKIEECQSRHSLCFYGKPFAWLGNSRFIVVYFPVMHMHCDSAKYVRHMSSKHSATNKECMKMRIEDRDHKAYARKTHEKKSELYGLRDSRQPFGYWNWRAFIINSLIRYANRVYA